MAAHIRSGRSLPFVPSDSTLRTCRRVALAMALSPFLLAWPFPPSPSSLMSWDAWSGLSTALVATGALLAAAQLVLVLRRDRADPARRPLRLIVLSVPLALALTYVGLFALLHATVWALFTSPRAATYMELARLTKNADVYQHEFGHYPRTLADLAREPLPLIDHVPLDSWGRAFRLHVTASTFTLCSDAEDGHATTDDDLCLAVTSTSAGPFQVPAPLAPRSASE